MAMAQPVNGDDDDDDGTEVTCHRCEYTWVYSGERWTATCPNCNAKTDTGLAPDSDDE